MKQEKGAFKLKLIEDSSIRVNNLARYTTTFIILVVVPSLITIVPWVIHWQGYFAFDTISHLRFCRAVLEGRLIDISLEWQRPLYMVTIVVLGAIFGCPVFFFDVVVIWVGLVLLGIVVYVLVRQLLPWPYVLLVVFLLLSYWGPVFRYAGFQTNLFALPMALLMLYYLLDPGHRDVRRTSVLSLVLGLWHPWTLAHYTLVYVIGLLLLEVCSSGRCESPGVFVRRLRSLVTCVVRGLVALLPGWVAHLVVAFLAGGSSVVGVGYASVAGVVSYLWGVRIYLWGTLLRPDIYLPLIVLLAWRLRDGRGLRGIPMWLLAPVVFALAALPLPDSRMLMRIYVNTPFPLLLAYLLAERRSRILALVVAVSSTLTLYHFMASLQPVA